jgi:hypothetical protein
MVSLREKPLCDKHSPPTATVILDEETIETFRRKHATNPPSWHINYGVFYTGKKKVVKITCSSSDVVLQTTKHTVIYPGPGPSLEVIALHPAACY